MTTRNAKKPKPPMTLRWRSNFAGIDPTSRRLARYTMYLLLDRRQQIERRLRGEEELRLAWELVSPLVYEPAATCNRRVDRAVVPTRADYEDLELPELGFDLDDDDDDRESRARARALRRRQREFLLSPPAGLLERLVQADGVAPTHPTIATLARRFGFGMAEACILDYVEKRHQHHSFAVLLQFADCADVTSNLDLLARAVGLPSVAIRKALAARSVLRACRLIRLCERTTCDMEDFLTAEDVLGKILLAAPETDEELTGILIEPASPATRTLADFPHLETLADDAATALSAAGRNAVPGVNALFYGPAGYGKTELALAVAAAAGMEAFLIPSADDDGEGMDREDRLGAYLLAQRLLANHRNAVIIFDEVEDVFSHQGALLASLFGGRAAAGQQKGWVNRILEENVVPAIWITNDEQAMDLAFLRRFLLPVEFVRPPQLVRRRMVDQHLGRGKLPEPLLESLAADPKLAPAQFSAARQVLALHTGEKAGDPAAGAAVVQRSVAAMRRLLHGSGLPAVRRSATEFELAFLNVGGGIAPARIADALERRGRGTLCFFGAPGTGKTEFAHVLADALGRELVVRRGSDLLSKWLGETEANIAGLFRNTDPERSVLFLDEVDSFLRDRRQAEHSWETTQVNELLQQMEDYPGIFIAATNLGDNLDAAALRRFDFKLHFRPLAPEQRVAMFAREALGSVDRVAEIPVAIRHRLARLETLTAGDFTNVCRQRDLLGEALSAEEFLRRLLAECRWKVVGEAA